MIFEHVVWNARCFRRLKKPLVLYIIYKISATSSSSSSMIASLDDGRGGRDGRDEPCGGDGRGDDKEGAGTAPALMVARLLRGVDLAAKVVGEGSPLAGSESDAALGLHVALGVGRVASSNASLARACARMKMTLWSSSEESSSMPSISMSMLSAR